MKNFALIGVGGYVAPRHLRAIKDTGNNLVAAYDKNDSVGIIDSYFPKASFFTEQELFDRHNNWFLSQGNNIDYLSVCSPNYLHDAHTRYGLRLGCDVICEKPVVLSPWNIDALEEIEHQTGHKAYTIFQLRLHPSVVELKKKIEDIMGSKSSSMMPKEDGEIICAVLASFFTNNIDYSNIVDDEFKNKIILICCCMKIYRK